MPQRINRPGTKDWAERERGSVRKGAEATKNAETEPLPPRGRMLFEFQSGEKKQGNEQRAKARVPDKAAGNINKIGIKRPNPARGGGCAAAKTAEGDVEDGEARESRAK